MSNFFLRCYNMYLVVAEKISSFSTTYGQCRFHFLYQIFFIDDLYYNIAYSYESSQYKSAVLIEQSIKIIKKYLE
uniref:Putative secreted protein n=1 Tax=Xenopsylla cheopis TaxID=163159 RepID=A0A6M2E1F6_XENCH